MNKITSFNYLYNGIWGVTYDPTTKTVLVGYAVDAQSFIPTFMVTETDGDDVEIAVIMCVELYSSYGVIITTFEKLINEYLIVCC